MSERSERSEATSQEEKMKSNLKIIGVWSLSGIVVLWTLHFCFVGPGVDWWKDFSLSDLQTQPRVVYPNPQPSVSVRQTSQSSSAGSSSSGVGLRDETEKITLAYDGQREKDQNTTVLELTIPPVAPKKTAALDEDKKEQSQQDTSTTWSQWVVMPLDCKHWFEYNTEKPAEFVLEVQYRDGSTVSHTEFKGSTFPVHQKAVWKFRFRNEGAADFIVVSHLQKL